MAVDRRNFLISSTACIAVTAAGGATAFANEQYLPDEPFDIAVFDPRQLPQKFRRQLVDYETTELPGTIVVNTHERLLYLVMENGKALSYGIGVGREGFAWNGAATIKRKAPWPNWHPPEEMREREPDLPEVMEGGPENPLGARALYLFEGDRDTLYRIHGTNLPNSIGTAVSSGCIRMLNQDVIDLYRRVPVGSKVVVVGPSLAPESVRQAYRSERSRQLESANQTRKNKRKRSFRENFLSIFGDIDANR